jgi:hypothetical protein
MGGCGLAERIIGFNSIIIIIIIMEGGLGQSV